MYMCFIVAHHFHFRYLAQLFCRSMWPPLLWSMLGSFHCNIPVAAALTILVLTTPPASWSAAWCQLLPHPITWMDFFSSSFTGFPLLIAFLVIDSRPLKLWETTILVSYCGCCSVHSSIWTYLHLLLGRVLLVHSLLGWFCSCLGSWDPACSLELFCHAFIGRLDA